MSALEHALAEAGGAEAPATATAGLRKALDQALARGREELQRKRSGYEEPVLVALAQDEDGILAVLPVDATLRADAAAVPPRAWTVVAALVAALAETCAAPQPTRPQELLLRAGAFAGDHLILRLEPAADPELAALAFDERVEGADRLRARAVVVPAAVLADADDLRDPIGPSHPLKVAEAVARLGGDPADPEATEALEDLLAVVLGSSGEHARPHEDPDPARRVARRILQRLAGMGKWGGYHTEFAHLPRGFAGNDRALAMDVGEALLQAGLLLEKPSVGQRHVYLNPRRARDVYAFVDEGRAPPDLRLPQT